jgi:tetraacyldisaccharide 4'-kinase
MLKILSWIYRFFWEIRKGCYRLGIFPTKKIDARVVCVGNLTTGGTGKTPMVIGLGEWFLDQGYRTAIVTRGYGGKSRGKVLLVSGGGGDPERRVDADQSGDEARLMADLLPGIPVLASKDRYAAGTAAVRDFSSEIVILDDGFQHFALHRDLNLLLIDSTFPFGGGELLPKGRLREPLDGIRRADAVILTRTDQVADTAGVEAVIRARHPRVPIFKAAHELYSLADPVSGKSFPPGDHLFGHRAVLFSGIGNPSGFRRSIESLGGRVAEEIRFPDHHRYTVRDRDRIRKAWECHPGSLLITTEKDWIRFQQLPSSPEKETPWVARIRMKMSDPEGWTSWLSERLAEQGTPS